MESRENQERFGMPTFQDMEKMENDGLDYNGQHIAVKFIMCCDWKAATLLCGMQAPCSKENFCLWCKCSKIQIADFSICDWPISRSLHESQVCLSLAKQDNRGYKNASLTHIDFCDIVPDNLHLRIRITLKLFNQLVSWAVDQNRRKELQTEMERINVPFHFWEERGDDGKGSVTKWNQPDGDGLWKLIRDLHISNILLPSLNDKRLVKVESLSMNQLQEELEKLNLPKKGKKVVLVARLEEALGKDARIPKKGRLRISYGFSEEWEEEEKNVLDLDGLQQLWRDFYALMNALKARPGSEFYLDADSFRAEARLWASKFADLTFPEDVVPYLHCMVYHVPQFLARFAYIQDLGVHQVETKNFDHREAYFQSTHRGGGRHPVKVGRQILERENRLMFAENKGLHRTPRKYTKKCVNYWKL